MGSAPADGQCARRAAPALPGADGACASGSVSVRPCMREDALASVFVTVCACVLLCVRLYACAGGLTCVHLGGGAYTCLCVRTCVSLCVQVWFCAYPDVGIWMREGMRVFLETRVSAESCSST